MKTNIKISILLFMSVFLTNCDTDIPETDTTAPKFTFRITGNDFEYTFNQDTDYQNLQLNLTNNADYDVFYTGSDAGGVKQIQWQLPISDYIEFDTPIHESWESNVSGLSRTITWYGDPNAPVTGRIFAGTFEALGENISDSFRFFISDFGGDSGNSNTLSKELNIYIGNHPTELINL